MSPYENLRRLGITLPTPTAPVAALELWVLSGNLLFVSGHIAKRNGAPWTGQLGREFSTPEGQEAARGVAIDLLGTLHAATGDLGRIRRIVKLLVLVNSTPEFTEQHLVANGASELLAAVLGDRAKHARSAFGAAQLPFGSCVEIELIAELPAGEARRIPSSSYSFETSRPSGLDLVNARMGTVPSTLVSLADFRRAATALRAVAVRTPLLPSAELEAQAGIPVFLKPEMLQRGGSFKFRGAYWYVSQLAVADRARGLVAPSSGNHGQAVALAAKLFGVTATIVMPTTAPRAKSEGAKRLGAKVVFEGTTTAERMAKAVEIRDNDGLTLVPPYDDPGIIAAQGTMGLEIVEDLEDSFGISDPFTVLVPVGGGGLSAGVAASVKHLAPSARVVAVEPTGSPKLSRARAAGEPVTIPANPDGLADALLAVRVGSLPFEHHEAFIDDIVTVDDAALKRAMKFLLERHKLVAEPSGAITVAALLEGVVRPVSPVVCVLSGGNVDWDGLRSLFGDG